MPLTREKKQKIIEQLQQKIKKLKSVVFLNIAGLKVKDLTELRKEMKRKNCELKVVKKTLGTIAFQREGMDVNLKQLEGEVALGFGYSDEVLPFKIIYEFSKDNENIKILGGIIEKKGKIFGKEEALKVAKLPSKKELLGKIIATFQNPPTQFVFVLKENMRRFIWVLSQIKK